MRTSTTLYPTHRSLILLLFMLLGVTARGQQIWTEGTTWEIERTDVYPSTSLFELGVAEQINGRTYHPLTYSQGNRTDTLAFIRTERGDSLVYAMHTRHDATDFLAYDYTRVYEEGDTIRYGNYHGDITHLPIDQPLTYYYDVIDEGDCLPSFAGFIYLIGHIEGPLALFFAPASYDPGFLYAGKPKPSNVSHVLFGTKGKPKKMIVPASLVAVRVDDEGGVRYSLHGTPVQSDDIRSVFIYRGQKYLIIDNR